jgi:hypothetical protein
MLNILFLINNDIAAVHELVRVADLVRRAPEFRPVALIEESVYTRQHIAARAMLEERGIEVMSSNQFSGGDGMAALGKRGSAMRRTRAKLISEALPAVAGLVLPSYKIIRGLRHFRQHIHDIRDAMLRRAAVCDAVLSQRRYSAVILSEDNVELDTGIWTTIARRHGVRSIIVPYTMSDMAEFAESFVNHSAFQVGATYQNSLVARLFPEWTLQYKGSHFLRSTYGKVIAVELLGLKPPNPWIMNSGYADAIAVESVAMREYCLAASLPASQLVVTGSLADDIIAVGLNDMPRRRRALLEELGLPSEAPILLCALPPDQNTYNRPGCEFTSFDALAHFWGECLSEIPAWNVIVRPHPKTPPECLGVLRNRGITITYKETAAVVPLCDLYVASVSSTIRWAIACGKPVINYDVYQYGYHDYDGLRGVVLANTRNEFRELLQEMTIDRDRRDAVAAAQRRDSGRWGRLDGLSGERMLALLRGEELPNVTDGIGKNIEGMP